MRFVPAPPELAGEVLGVVVLRTDVVQPVTTPAHATALFTLVLRGSLQTDTARTVGAGTFLAAGSATQARVTVAAAGTVCATLVCRASVFPRLWGEPAHVFAGAALPLRGVLAAPVDDWRALAGTTASDDALAAMLFAWAASLLRKARPRPPGARRFDAALADWPALRAPGRVAAPAGWSERAWQRACRDELGVSPKLLLRLARLHASLRQQAAQPRAWAEHALDLGFGDQPHLARDYRLLAGAPATRAVNDPSLRLGAQVLAPRFFGGPSGGFFQAGARPAP